MNWLPPLTSQQLLKALIRGVFVINRMNSTHYQLTCPNNSRLILIVPRHHRTLKRSTVRSILQQAGLTEEQFLNLL